LISIHINLVKPVDSGLDPCEIAFAHTNTVRIYERSGVAGTNNSVDRALDLLGIVARSRGPVRFTDLVKISGIPKGTLHTLLASLESAQFLERTADGYRIGIRAFEVGTSMPMPASLRDAVAPALDQLAATTHEACHLGMLAGGDVVYLDRRDTGEGLRFASRIGQRLPAHATGLGKAMLALLPDDEIATRCPEVLPRVTPLTVGTRAQLMDVVTQVRARGYSVESEESTPGVCCIGAAVLGPDGPLGLSITVPVQRASVDQLVRYLPDLTEALDRIQEVASARHWFGSATGALRADYNSDGAVNQ
jgi:IclR family acetate operon transcriptional repressor